MKTTIKTVRPSHVKDTACGHLLDILRPRSCSYVRRAITSREQIGGSASVREYIDARWARHRKRAARTAVKYIKAGTLTLHEVTGVARAQGTSYLIQMYDGVHETDVFDMQRVAEYTQMVDHMLEGSK